MKILLLEDDITLNESLKEYLLLEGYIVESAYNAVEAYEMCYKNRYDLYIFDINLPDEDGFRVISNLKESNDTTPIIIITALSDTNSIIKGFKLGVLDYIKKPFDPEELLVRIKSRFPQDELIEYKDIIFYPQTKEIYKNGKLVTLGEVGSNIIELFLKNIGNIIDTQTLLNILKEPSPNALRVNLAKLKKKLNIDFKNIRGQGYMLEKI